MSLHNFQQISDALRKPLHNFQQVSDELGEPVHTFQQASDLIESKGRGKSVGGSSLERAIAAARKL